jgi:2-amino-4-hydroxy-6-hydroxymethyldihydropteridine diphosphokinase
MRWESAYVGLGSNLDDPRGQIRWAAAKLKQRPDIRSLSCSGIYLSAPMGPKDQPDYLNAVCGLLTSLTAADLLGVLHEQEEQRGRQRNERWGPRTLDLDLLVYGRERSDCDKLMLPHPGVHERSFVLYPLAEIAPTLEIPGRGRVSQLAAACGRQGLKHYADAGDNNT